MAKTFKINGNVYPVREMDFNFICFLGDEGIDMSELGTKKLKAMRAYLAFCGDITPMEAGNEINEHFINGGDITELSEAFETAGEESRFFTAILKEEPEKKPEEKPEEKPKRTKKAAQ